MAHRGYIAKVEPNGSGRYIYLGHGSNPIDTGQVLLQHYQEPGKVDALLDLGSIPYVEPELHQIIPYYPDEDQQWTSCQPHPFTGGADAFFLVPYLPGPEWLYCWTPAGWLAAPVQDNDMPTDYTPRVLSMPPEEFDHWFLTNPSPHWVAWRNRCIETQRPNYLLQVITGYAAQRQAWLTSRAEAKLEALQ